MINARLGFRRRGNLIWYNESARFQEEGGVVSLKSLTWNQKGKRRSNQNLKKIKP
jgi:hypothetical protein